MRVPMFMKNRVKNLLEICPEAEGLRSQTLTGSKQKAISGRSFPVVGFPLHFLELQCWEVALCTKKKCYLAEHRGSVPLSSVWEMCTCDRIHCDEKHTTLTADITCLHFKNSQMESWILHGRYYQPNLRNSWRNSHFPGFEVSC